MSGILTLFLFIVYTLVIFYAGKIYKTDYKIYEDAIIKLNTEKKSAIAEKDIATRYMRKYFKGCE